VDIRKPKCSGESLEAPAPDSHSGPHTTWESDERRRCRACESLQQSEIDCLRDVHALVVVRAQHIVDRLEFQPTLAAGPEIALPAAGICRQGQRGGHGRCGDTPLPCRLILAVPAQSLPSSGVVGGRLCAGMTVDCDSCRSLPASSAMTEARKPESGGVSSTTCEPGGIAASLFQILPDLIQRSPHWPWLRRISGGRKNEQIRNEINEFFDVFDFLKLLVRGPDQGDDIILDLGQILYHAIRRVDIKSVGFLPQDCFVLKNHLRLRLIHACLFDFFQQLLMDGIRAPGQAIRQFLDFFASVEI
jgi:hypothetical protein